MRLGRWILAFVVAASATVIAVYVLGLTLPERHLASAQRAIQMDVLAAAERIRDVDAYPQWQTDVAISGVMREGAATLYTETRGGRAIRYSLAETEPDRRFVAHILDETLPFGGSWTIVLEPQESGTQVMIVESGVIRNPFFRVFYAYVFGHSARMNAFLDALAATGRARA